MRMITKMLSLAVLAAIAFAAAGCSTTEGFGADVEAGGKAIKDSAREHGN
jgi:predicted small secreted protein